MARPQPPQFTADPLEPRLFLTAAPAPLQPQVVRVLPRHALVQNFATIVAAPSWTIQSPTAQISATITLDSAGRPSYTVNRAGASVLLPSPLGVTMPGATGNFSSGLQFVSQSSRAIDETFSLLSGKSASSRNRATETTLTFRN